MVDRWVRPVGSLSTYGTEKFPGEKNSLSGRSQAGSSAKIICKEEE